MAELSLPDFEKMMGDLLGAAVAIKRGALPTSNAGVAGAYVDADGNHAAGVWFDKALAAYVGASLAMVPKEAAEDAIKAEQLPDNLVENAGEVMNVLGPLLNPTHHVRLEAAVQVPPAPPALAGLVGEPNNKNWLVVDVTGYGTGMALVIQKRPAA